MIGLNLEKQTTKHHKGITCVDCGKILLKEDKGKTWNEFFIGFPSCIECDKKVFDKIDRNMKVMKNNIREA